MARDTSIAVDTTRDDQVEYGVSVQLAMAVQLPVEVDGVPCGVTIYVGLPPGGMLPPFGRTEGQFLDIVQEVALRLRGGA